jgi:hypothetical membrane protein
MREGNARANAARETEAGSTKGSSRSVLGRNVIAIATWGLVAGFVVQVYLSGIGVFRGNFELHRNVGYLLGLAAIVVFLLLLAVRASRRQIALGGLLVILVILQSVFVMFRTSTPEIAALHPVNGFVILVVSLVLARTTWRLGGLTDL